MPEARVELALRNALESEADLAEHDGADERLLTLLGMRGSRTPNIQEEDKGSTQAKSRRPGKREPGRDLTGEGATILSDEEQAAG